MLKPTKDDEEAMPIDLRALFSVRMYRKAEVPFDLGTAESRAEHGVWRFDQLDIDGSPWVIVFSSK
ncbi:hypothetical protein [Sorangium sp. So ce542]|uniref:hypothetical protein n=1 Tax=Sorangium sp. So ce542 TaxID=3133316 RepID=UPI003F5D726E